MPDVRAYRWQDQGGSYPSYRDIAEAHYRGSHTAACAWRARMRPMAVDRCPVRPRHLGRPYTISSQSLPDDLIPTGQLL